MERIGLGFGHQEPLEIPKTQNCYIFIRIILYPEAEPGLVIIFSKPGLNCESSIKTGTYADPAFETAKASSG